MEKTLHPPTVKARELAEIIGGNCFHGLIPQTQLVLEQIATDNVLTTDGPIPAMSAEEWVESWDAVDSYYELESHMREGGQIPPVVVKRKANGMWWLDGYHRISIARHLGITHLDAYVACQ